MNVPHPSFMQKVRLMCPAWLLALILILVASAGIAYAQVTPPPALGESADVPFNGDLYRIRFTTTCAPNDPTCDCDDAINTVDYDGNPISFDLTNTCIAEEDTNGDGIFDQPQDMNGNGVADIVDPDWDGGDGTSAESLVNMLTGILSTYDAWGMLAPHFEENPVDQSRDIWIHGDTNDEPNKGEFVGVYKYSHVELLAEYMRNPPFDSRQTLTHEMWHAIQHAYGSITATTGKWFFEGQARMIPDRVWEDIDYSPEGDFIAATGLYLTMPNWPVQIDSDGDNQLDIAQAQGLLGTSYNAALWWTYLVEQAGALYTGTTSEGADFLKAVLEQSLPPTQLTGWDAVDATLRQRIGRGFDLTFWDFTIANYARDFDLSLLNSASLDGRDPQRVLRYRDEGPVGTALRYEPVIRETIAATDLLAGRTGLVAGVAPLVDNAAAMPPYGVNYYEGLLPTPAECPVAYWRVDSASEAPFMHSFLLLEDRDSNGIVELTGLSRHQGAIFGRAVVNRPEYHAIAGIITTGGETESYAWQMGCEDVAVSIVEPTDAFPAAVGDPTQPGRFLVWVEVKGTTSGSLVVELDPLESFGVQVGGVNAQVLQGDVVQNRYWLVVQAPTMASTANGQLFDLRVELQNTAANDVSAQSVLYESRPREQVLLLDRSGSMADEDKLIGAQSAARLFVDTTRQGDQLGIVSFNDTVSTDFNMRLIPDQDDAAGIRAAANLALNGLTAAGDTAIGAALSRGQSLLNSDPETIDNWLVLLSDGINTTGMAPLTVLNTVVAPADTKVHTIALGHSADHNLMRAIAAITCGGAFVDHCFHATDEVDGAPVQASAVQGVAQGAALNLGLADTYLRIAESMANHQRLWQGAGNGQDTASFQLEDVRGSDALLSVYWGCDQKPGAVKLTVPNGLKVIERSDVGHSVYYLPELTSGDYRIELGGDCEWRGVLSAYVTAGVEMHAFVDTLEAERKLYHPALLQVSLANANGPVAGANVSATVYRFDGAQEQILLRDDGVGPHDDEAGDGVYGYSYDRVNGVEQHNITFDIAASGQGFTRYQRLTYRPAHISRIDSDGDGLPDVWQARYNVAGATKDPDGDQLTNQQEMDLGTNPTLADSDRGGENDGSEVTSGHNPLDATDDVALDMADFWCESGQAEAILHFNSRADFERIRVWRVENASGAASLADFKAIGDFSPTDGQIVDTDVKNGENYLYMLQALTAGGKTAGGYTNQQLCQPAADPYPPQSYLSINAGARTTDKYLVQLYMAQTYEDGRPEIKSVKLSNTPNIHDAKWTPFSEEMAWKIEPDPDTGVATVYALFLDDAGNVSPDVYTDSIRFGKSGGTFGDEFTIYLPLLKR
ncbi:MAG: VWA domain-containing protein [Caldilineaceae bacterium]|nr:VWA domain-containing protein [Caldilineaceae bacterium]